MPFAGAVLDLDGTVYRGDSLLPGAAEAVEALRAAGIPVVFFSNNPTKSRAAYADLLASLGIDVDPAAVLSAGSVTTEYLAENHADDRIYLVGDPGLEAQFREADLDLTADPDRAEVVVASWDRSFDYETMVDALRAVDDDTVFLGTDPDRVVPVEGGEMPGSGAIIHAVEGVVEREVDRVLGKPSGVAVEAARTALGAPPGECLVVGDRLETDIALGERADMTTALVLTGIADRETLANSPVRPDHVLESVGDVVGLL